MSARSVRVRAVSVESSARSCVRGDPAAGYAAADFAALDDRGCGEWLYEGHAGAVVSEGAGDVPLGRGLAARMTPSQAVSVHCSLVQARTAWTRSRPVMAICVACVIASSAQSGASQPGVMAMMVLPPTRACAATGPAHGPWRTRAESDTRTSSGTNCLAEAGTV